VNKSKLRGKILKLRKKNLHKKLKLYPNMIFRFLKKNKLNFKNVGGYYPCNYEIDDLDLLNFLRKKKANISLPIIRENNQMDFFEWTNKDCLKINKYGIVEPISAKKIYPDIIFVPLVAYDDDLNRLGYGGGFYDRYFENIAKIKKILKIGLGFSYQELKKIPINKYDKKLDLIITEKKIIQ
jgi:5-formyltetrahydrofolate cyclo-ligase